jgi:hypothetical protein
MLGFLNLDGPTRAEDYCSMRPRGGGPSIRQTSGVAGVKSGVPGDDLERIPEDRIAEAELRAPLLSPGGFPAPGVVATFMP